MDISKIDPAAFALAEKKVAKRMASLQITNLFGAYSYFHSAGDYEACYQLFALSQPDVSCEIADLGKQVGAENVRKVIVDYQNLMRGDGVGFHSEHNLGTPVLEVANDGLTAKGIWQSPGHVTYTENGRLKPLWSWFKYGVEFIKQDGTWKIWHLHAYELFTADYATGWTQPMPQWMKAKIDAAKKAAGLDGSIITHYNPYGKDFLAEYYPMVPDAYDTYSGNSEII